MSFAVETDASDIATAATLNLCGRPVASFSHTLSPAEHHHSSVEKEVYAVVELVARHFTLVTDQRSVSYMFSKTHKSKIQNDKLLRWRIEMSPYRFPTLEYPDFIILLEQRTFLIL